MTARGMGMRGLITAIAVYVTCTFLTFGYVVNRPGEAGCNYGDSDINQGCARATGVVLGGLWPAFWAGKAAIAITQP